jgi:hypothetical protein
MFLLSIMVLCWKSLRCGVYLKAIVPPLFNEHSPLLIHPTPMLDFSVFKVSALHSTKISPHILNHILTQQGHLLAGYHPRGLLYHPSDLFLSPSTPTQQTNQNPKCVLVVKIATKTSLAEVLPVADPPPVPSSRPCDRGSAAPGPCQPEAETSATRRRPRRDTVCATLQERIMFTLVVPSGRRRCRRAASQRTQLRRSLGTSPLTIPRTSTWALVLLRQRM